MTIHSPPPADEDSAWAPRQAYFGSSQQSQYLAAKREILSPGLHKIALQGDAGIGKSFFVDELRRDLDVKEHYSVFLSVTIREGSTSLGGAYATLWKRFKRQTSVPFTGESRLEGLLRQELTATQVLLVVDDIRDAAQAEKLCSILDCKSAIIITCASSVQLPGWKTFCLDPLSAEASGRLLLHYAFPRLSHEVLFKKVKSIGFSLVDRVITGCKGIPAVLQVAGASLTSSARWVNAGQALNDSPPDDVHAMLQLCYDLLGHELVQGCLLDMVAYPKQYEWTRAELMQFWQHSHNITAAEASYCEKVLSSRQFLQQVNSGAYDVPRVKLHGLFYNLAVGIVSRCESCVEKLRLCCPGNQNESAVPAAWLVNTGKASFWGGSSTITTYEANIISLMWSNIESWLPPTNANFPSTRVMLFTNCLRLKRLKLRGAESSLRRLDLKNCTSLEFLPEKLQACSALEELNLKRCIQLTELPGSFSKLVKLRVLKLEGCSNLKYLPKGMECLTGLQLLTLKGCASLGKLPSGIGYCDQLTDLPLDFCSSLSALPDTIRHLTSLGTLRMRHCAALTLLPDGLHSLSNLEELDLRACTSLRELGSKKGMGHMPKLEKLNLKGCASLMELPVNVGALSALKELDIRGCASLSAVPDSLADLIHLTSLSFEGCSKVSCLPPNTGALTNLQQLICSECIIWKLPESIGQLTGLKLLNASNCCSMQELPQAVSSLRSLETLILTGCEVLSSFPSTIQHLSSLQHLSLSRCDSISRLPPTLPLLSSLQHLSLSHCTELLELPPDFSLLSSLTTLQLSHCSSLTHLPTSFGRLPALRELDLRHCRLLRSVPANFCQISTLEVLYLDSCLQLDELPVDFGSLCSLTELSLANCIGLRKLPVGLCLLTDLQKLYLQGCTGLTELPPGCSKLKSLQELNLTCCSNLTALPKNLDRLKALQSVLLWDCDSLGCAPEEMGLAPGVAKGHELKSDNVRFGADSIFGFNEGSIDSEGSLSEFGGLISEMGSASTGLSVVFEEEEEGAE